jgi:hypothetical protein
MTGGLGDVLGPVQVLLIGLDQPGSERMLAAELQDLRWQDAVRALDLLRVRRDPDGGLRRLDPPDPEDFSGGLVEALLVRDPDIPEEGEGTWSLADRVPRGTAVAIILLEHRWAIPLREAAAGVDAEVFGDAWVHPRDLAAARRAVGYIGD